MVVFTNESQSLGLLIICLGLMPSKNLNTNWDIEDPNAEIPHLPENQVIPEENSERRDETKDGSDVEDGAPKAVHVKTTSMV